MHEIHTFHPLGVLNPGQEPIQLEDTGRVSSPWGDAKVEAYRSGGGAAYYVAKMFPCEDTSYDMGGLEHFARLPEVQPELVRS